jgi:hypothetical protein
MIAAEAGLRNIRSVYITSPCSTGRTLEKPPGAYKAGNRAAGLAGLPAPQGNEKPPHEIRESECP